jgi:glycine/D-amino acid oxidase-like deaminating enzyme
MKSAGISVEELTVVEATRRFPVIRFPTERRIYFESQSGYLAANQACQQVVEAFVAEGGLYRQSHVRIKRLDSGAVTVDDGENLLQADQIVFACGPWLRDIAIELFGDSYADMIRPTRQESIYFGTPAGDRRYSDAQLPVWIDHGHHVFYGIPGNGYRGLKIADDTRGPPVDPELNDRTPTTDALERARNYLALRFPDLANAPINETRTCTYENSPDGHYLIGRVPTAPHFWLVGGGSGHGFKMGPAIGEVVAQSILDGHPIDPMFQLDRRFPQTR